METKQLLIRVPEELKKLLVNEANRKGLTLNALIVSVLWNALRK